MDRDGTILSESGNLSWEICLTKIFLIEIVKK